MALPKINTPTYELVIPSTDEKIKYRPFLVKEEKILMMALESKENSQIIGSVKEIVKTCTFEKVDISKLPMFDMEYIFLQIRSKSVGEVSQIRVLAPDDEKTMIDTVVDLSKVEVEVGEGHNPKIDLGNKLGVLMKYPTIDSFADSDAQEITAANMLDVIVSCIAHISDGEEVFESKDQTKAEMIDFVEQMNTAQFKEVQKFFDTMPKLKHTIKVTNPKTKKEGEVVLSGLNDFFV